MIRLKSNKGIAFILVFAVILVLSVLGTAIMSRSISGRRITERYVGSVQAFWIAEAGLNQALAALRSNYAAVAIGNTTFGAGGYSAVINTAVDGSKIINATGFVPFTNPRAQRTVSARMIRVSTTPPDFYGNAIYSGGNININGNAYDVTGKVIYAGTLTGTTSHITGTVTHDPTINPLARFNFDQLRTLSQAQGNYHDATHLNGPFPASFWYNQALGIPNIVFMEGGLDLSGKTSVGGFYVVGGEVTYDATLSGNVAVKGAIYTLGRFTINGGGNQLNVDGGIWSGQLSTLNGNAKMSYNSTYMTAIQNLAVDTDVQITAWMDTQNPY